MKTPVYLASGIEAAAEDNYRVFLEVSPHPIISHSVTQTLKGMEIDDSAVIPTMLRNMSSIRCLIRSCASLWCNGIKVDWKAQFSKTDWTRTVPKTQWKHESLWMNTTSDSADTTALHDPDTHTLLGQEIAVLGENVTMFKSRLSEEMKPFPGNHPLHGTQIIPAAILLNTFL
jgi:6-methylsalicylic acid synthase